MGITQHFLRRYWSLLVAFLIVAMEVYVCGVPFEPAAFEIPERAVWGMCMIYAFVLALCLGLLVHSWQIQRGLTRNKWRLVFWTRVLLFPALTSIVLGLDEVQAETYDLSLEREKFQYLHWYSGRVKEGLIWVVMLNFILIILWAIIAMFKSKPSRPNTKAT